MTGKKAVKKVLVGIVLKSYVDEEYIRDRDLIVPLFENEDNDVAIKLYIEEMNGWLHTSEYKYVKVIKEFEETGFYGHEIYRK